MSTTVAGILFAGSLVLAVAVAYRPLGDYMYRVYSGEKDSRVERGLYRLIGVKSGAEQTWATYARSVLAFSVVSILFLYLLQRVQDKLFLSLGFAPVKPDQAWNTAVSFVTNTNWQSYSGETTMGYLVQMSGLAVQNFVSAAVGMAVAIALVRGFARRRSDHLGNFWVDLTRGSIRILLPIAFVGAVLLIAAWAGPELRRPAQRHHPGRRAAADPGRAGGQPGSDQGARHQRRRLLQRQRRAPVRERGDLDELAGDLPDPGHPVRPVPHVRPDGRAEPAGLRDQPA